MPELDYASIINAGQGLVGNLQDQMFLTDQRRQQQQAQGIKIQQAQKAQERQGLFQRDVAEAVHSGDPRAIGRLMVQYPEFADQIKPGWEALSADARRTNLTQTGIIYQRASAGDAKGAAALLRKRYEADVAAGQGDETTKEILDGLEGGDPQEVKIAIGSLGMILASDDPAKFGEVYGKLNPTDAKSAFAKEYNDRVGIFGKAAADNWAATQDEKFIPVQAGGSVFRASDLMGNPQVTPTAKGGDQSPGGRGIAPTGSAIESAAMSAVPGLIVTSRQRTAGKNADVGGVGNSYHMTDQARDFVPPKGMSMGGLHAKLAKAFPGFDVINEGDHVHVEPGAGTPHRVAPVKVRSVQEARNLPSGTEFITPDGRTMRKP
ncbi:D-Ala-D-Ala carboxypeptidase family metallohydrolase [Novosphingobium sp. MMS21-SN21R]|uniref:D-Ala-D-Ala carboxypeptidase family metallohydrolase n=1 Tax=Novosphingobium sp. MMS21-SN21R TaxID=2969298 RepID=UPI0028862FA8|nr:D-Ala-D-Ala carboxypeptidase family metallohydrolase [Novosphingobium sp. MMS21-SN21R]MDT0507535.1 D-Ala-D-Ala carboxypeptidase family metallohydrolase [Novosphingobium sp. MMS21-SN21R]